MFGRRGWWMGVGKDGMMVGVGWDGAMDVFWLRWNSG